jgi:hypothetical protein
VVEYCPCTAKASGSSPLTSSFKLKSKNKGLQGIPWHSEAMKDVVNLRKVSVSWRQAITRKYPNKETCKLHVEFIDM